MSMRRQSKAGESNRSSSSSSTSSSCSCSSPSSSEKEEEDSNYNSRLNSHTTTKQSNHNLNKNQNKLRSKNHHPSKKKKNTGKEIKIRNKVHERSLDSGGGGLEKLHNKKSLPKLSISSGIGIDNPTFYGDDEEEEEEDDQSLCLSQKSQSQETNVFHSNSKEVTLSKKGLDNKKGLKGCKGEGKHSKGSKKTSAGGKKFPPTPTQLYKDPHLDLDLDSLISQSPSFNLNNANDLIYHNDNYSSSNYQSDSSSESSSSSEDHSKKRKSKKRQKRKSKISSTQFNYSYEYEERSASNSNTILNIMKDLNRAAGSGDQINNNGSRRSSLYEKPPDFNSDLNQPCSSSSLRERLNQVQNNLDAKNDTFTNVLDVQDGVSGVGGGVSGCGNGFNNGSGVSLKEITRTKSNGSLGMISSLKNTNNNNNKPPPDKYILSGVGRHFGRKKTLSDFGIEDEGDGIEGVLPGDGSENGRTSRIEELLQNVNLPEWTARLKAVSIVFLATLFILSSSSLLFVFPIIIDPILLGLDAQFSNSSVKCRTTNIRNGSGPTECSMQSCREGCTADYFLCTFIEVEYSIDPNPDHYLPSKSINQDFNDNHTSFNQVQDPNQNQTIESDSFNKSSSELRRGTLFINVNGCGYPPIVNCTEFRKTYGIIDHTFECYFSQNNGSILVPNYNLNQQKQFLFLALAIPIGLSIGSAIALTFLFKCRVRCDTRDKLVSKSDSTVKLFQTRDGPSDKNIKDKEGGGQLHNKSNGISHHGGGHQMNGSIPKANGHAFTSTISGLMGMSSPAKIHESIKTLPHQHDNLDKSKPYLNGFILKTDPNANEQETRGSSRKPLYTKNSNSNKNKLFRNQSMDESRDSNHLLQHQNSNGNGIIHPTHPLEDLEDLEEQKDKTMGKKGDFEEDKF